MKIVKKNVYYCEHCNKRGLAAWHIGKHEKGCTANPNRECKMCGRQEIASVIEEYKKRFVLPEDEYKEVWLDGDHSLVPVKPAWLEEPVTLDEIRSSVDNCPCCILAVLRQTKLHWDFFGIAKDFDFKIERLVALSKKSHPEYY